MRSSKFYDLGLQSYDNGVSRGFEWQQREARVAKIGRSRNMAKMTMQIQEANRTEVGYQEPYASLFLAQM